VATPQVEPSSRAVWIGWAVLAILITIVSAVLYQARTQSDARAMPPRRPPPAEAEVRGFRKDAWYLPDDEMLGFVEIPAGPFLMGSDPAKDKLAFDNERWPVLSERSESKGPALSERSESKEPAATAQARVEVPAFYIGRFEVTNAQYAAFVEASGQAVAAETLRGPANHPVSAVTWPDAVAYGRWLESVMRQSSATPARLQQLLQDGWRVSLPSEAEWEKAARGTDGRIYPWGDEPRRDRAHFGGSAPVAVGSVQCAECAYGLADMSGNVWEWTRSPYQPYPFDPANDRAELERDALWVMRGGSFADTERNVRAAVRGGADPGARRAFIGFRLVISRALP
jgi:formylglycine-generating enzyme required for sulfatase activity